MIISAYPTREYISTIADVRRIDAQFILHEQAELGIFQTGSLIPFPMCRVFTVRAREASKRGRHAHKACSQAMACLEGACTVTVDDGTMRQRWRLDHPASVLVVPPLLWCEQDYDERGALLMVMCDRVYDESDYLREYAAFLAYRNQLVSN